MQKIGGSEAKAIVEALYSEFNWPQTLDEAVSRLLNDLDAESIDTLKQMAADDLIMLHFTFAAGIRSAFGLWGSNQKLIDDLGGGHADDMSMVIVEALWERVQGMS